MSQRRLLFVQHLFRPPGGGNTVANWALQALKDEFEVTVLTWEPVDWNEVNRFYGTTLDPKDFRVVTPSPLIRALWRLDPDPQSFQPLAYLMWLGKRKRAAYDVFFTVHNEHDFGGPGIQYIHYPYLRPHYQRPYNAPNAPWRQQIQALLKGQARFWQIYSQFSFERMKQNLTLVNSDWTGHVVSSIYGMPTTTVYPPVPADFLPIPWEQRENGFVCIGRLSGEKRYQAVVEIVGKVREQTPDAHLHIIGSLFGQAPGEKAYYQHVKQLVADHAGWVTLHEDISRQELTHLVARHRYGIHGMEDEHFGIAVAEMTLAGCIVFAPNSGGPVEILGHDERLLYGGVDEAVAKIQRVMSDPDQHQSLRDRLAAGADRYSIPTFMTRLRQIVREFEAVKP